MTGPDPVVIIPVKTLSQAKQRLAAVLTPSARQALAEAMLHDVLDCVHRWGRAQAVIASADPQVASIAFAAGALVCDRAAARGLNEAVEATVEVFAQTRAALVLPSDIPCVQPGELEMLLQAGLGNGHYAIAPDRSEDGTNAVCSMPSARVSARYGPASFSRHCSTAASLGLCVRVLRSPGLALDIDEPADLATCLTQRAGQNTRQLIGQWPDLTPGVQPIAPVSAGFRAA